MVAETLEERQQAAARSRRAQEEAAGREGRGRRGAPDTLSRVLMAPRHGPAALTHFSEASAETGRRESGKQRGWG